MLGTFRNLLVVEVGELRGLHVDRTDAQSHVFRVIDAIQINIPSVPLSEVVT
jgi:hypothetical protein